MHLALCELFHPFTCVVTGRLSHNGIKTIDCCVAIFPQDPSIRVVWTIQVGSWHLGRRFTPRFFVIFIQFNHTTVVTFLHFALLSWNNLIDDWFGIRANQVKFFDDLLKNRDLQLHAISAYKETSVKLDSDFILEIFRGLNEVYDIIPWTISILPGGFRQTFQILSSPVFLVVLGVVIW